MNNTKECEFIVRKGDVITDDYIQLSVASNLKAETSQIVDPMEGGSIPGNASIEFVRFLIGEDVAARIFGGAAVGGNSDTGDLAATDFGSLFVRSFKGTSLQILDDTTCYFTLYPAVTSHQPRFQGRGLVRIPRAKVSSFVDEIKDAQKRIERDAEVRQELKERARELSEEAEKAALEKGLTSE